ncbi:hypothetical protein B9Z55_027888 [Caenorhabditis nigoni]|nr:hypothetical protein B9Z55_027888 [Caenorhabditis nigoni]
MICFILKFAFIDVFEVKGNLDLNAADLEVISTSSPIFSINSNRGNVSKLSKLILEMADENILTDVQLCDPRTACLDVKEVVKEVVAKIAKMEKAAKCKYVKNGKVSQIVQKAPNQVTPSPVAVLDAKKTVEAIKANIDPPNTPKEKDPSTSED